MPDQGVSTVNSTHVPLAASGVFTGVWEQLPFLTAITVMAWADQDSAVDGVVFQWTNSLLDDESGPEIVEYQVTKTLMAGTAVRYESQRLAEWFRVVYTNGAVDQTQFDLEVIYDTDGSSRTIIENSELSGSGTLDGDGQTIVIDVEGRSVLTIQFEGTIDAGTVAVEISNTDVFSDFVVGQFAVEFGAFRVISSLNRHTFSDLVTFTVPVGGWKKARLETYGGFVGSLAVNWRLSSSQSAVYIANKITHTTGNLPLTDAESNAAFRLHDPSSAFNNEPPSTAYIFSPTLPFVFNGTTWERARAANVADGTAGTGVPAAGTMYWDGAAWKRWGGTVAATIADGADVAQGATSDADTASTVVGLLKKVKALLSAALSVTFTNTTIAATQGTSPWVGSVPDGNDAAEGATTDAAASSDAGTFSLIALFKRLLQKLTTQLPAALVSGRLDVSIGASPATVPVSAASLPLPSGAATETTLTGVLTTSDFDTKAGSLTETAPATDTASSGLNGRLQRIAQRVTSLIALLPSALVGGRLDVNLGAAPATVTVTGDVAHDGVDSGNPVKVGYKALAHGTNPTAVAANDRTDAYANRHGVPWVMGGHPNVVCIRANYTGAQTDAAIVTVASGLKIVVTRVVVCADKANTVNTAVRIGFGATTTPTTTGVVASHPGIEAGGGFATGDGSGILGVGADGEDLRITSGAPTTGSIDCVVSYYTVES